MGTGHRGDSIREFCKRSTRRITGRCSRRSSTPCSPPTPPSGEGMVARRRPARHSATVTAAATGHQGRHDRSPDPKLRKGTFFPECLLERRKRAETGLIAVVADSCLAGVWTRRIDKLVKTCASTHYRSPRYPDRRCPPASTATATPILGMRVATSETSAPSNEFCAYLVAAGFAASRWSPPTRIWAWSRRSLRT